MRHRAALLSASFRRSASWSRLYRVGDGGQHRHPTDVQRLQARGEPRRAHGLPSSSARIAPPRRMTFRTSASVSVCAPGFNRQRAEVLGERGLHDAPHQRRFVQICESDPNQCLMPFGNTSPSSLSETLNVRRRASTPLGLGPRLECHKRPRGARRQPQQRLDPTRLTALVERKKRRNPGSALFFLLGGAHYTDRTWRRQVRATVVTRLKCARSGRSTRRSEWPTITAAAPASFSISGAISPV